MGRYPEAMPESKSKKKAARKKATRKRAVRKSTTPAEVADRVKNRRRPKNPVGRPTKYTSEMPQALLDYFQCAWEDVKNVERNKSKVGVLQWVQKPAEIPLLESFAVEMGVCKDTLLEWASVHDDFSVAIKQAKHIAVRCALRLGAASGAPPAITIFTMKNIAGWTDKAVLELDGPVTLNFDSQDEDA